MSAQPGSATAAFNRARAVITPECQNIAKSIKFSSLLTIFVVLVAVILLASALIYNYVKKIPTGTNAGEGEATKKKVVGGLTIASLVVLVISLLTSIWEYAVVAKAADTCI